MTSEPAQGVLRGTPLLKDLPNSLSIHCCRTQQVLDYAGVEHRVAERLTGLHARLGQDPARVVIALSDPVDVLMTLFATWVAGHCAVLVNPKLAPEEKSRVTRSVAPKLWIDDAGTHHVPGDSARNAGPADAALILMTSGTTGDPKGVTLGLTTLEARLTRNVAEIGADTLQRTLCPLPLFFGHGLIGNCLTPLYAGQNLHILGALDLRDVAAFGALIDSKDITFLSSVPSMWRMVLRLSKAPSKPLRRVHVGSAPLTEGLWQDIEDWCGTRDVFNTFGMTETANWISGGTRPAKDADGFVGKPWGGSFRVLRDGALHTHGRGEVAIFSPSLMLGLWGGKATNTDRDAAFLTGDIGLLSADQSLRLIGRTKNEINRAGIKILAEEVDMMLERHPDVEEACAFAIPDDISGELVGAVVRVKPASDLTAATLQAWCRTQARHDAVPTRLEIVDEIPKNERGKIARQTVQQRMVETWC